LGRAIRRSVGLCRLDVSFIAGRMKKTTLNLLVRELDHVDDDLTIYTEGGSCAGPDAPAVAALEPEDGTVPQLADGLDYLLEVFIAKEVVEVWSQWRGGRRPTPAEALRAIVYYAKHDAFEPTDDE
jgi:hypothetical protein